MSRTSQYDNEGIRRLTARELEIIALIQQGFTNGSISARLGIAYSTVCTHVNNALGTVGVANRTALAFVVLLAQIEEGRTRKKAADNVRLSYPACCKVCPLRPLSLLPPKHPTAAR